MKSINKMVVLILSVLLLVVPTIAKEHGIRNEHMWVNGSMVMLSNNTGYMYIYNNNTYVPANLLTLKLGYSVVSDSKKVTVSKGNKKTTYEINNKGTEKNARTVNGKVYLPLRNLCNQMGISLNVKNGIIYLGDLPNEDKFWEVTSKGTSIFNKFIELMDNGKMLTCFYRDLDKDNVRELIVLTKDRKLEVYKCDLSNGKAVQILDGQYSKRSNIYLIKSNDGKTFGIKCYEEGFRDSDYPEEGQVVYVKQSAYIFNKESVIEINGEHEGPVESPSKHIKSSSKYTYNGYPIDRKKVWAILDNYVEIENLAYAFDLGNEYMASEPFPETMYEDMLIK